MKVIRKFIGLIMLMTIMASFSQCSSAKKLQKETPKSIGEVFYQKWVSGVSQGASGLNIFIEVINDDIKPDSVYFRGKAAKFEVKPNNKTLYIGRFINESKEVSDMVMHSDAKREYSNKAPNINTNIPFELNDNQCVISFISNNKTKYFKIDNIEERVSIDIPMSPKQNDN